MTRGGTILRPPSSPRLRCECSALLVEGRCPVCTPLRAPHNRRRILDATTRARERIATRTLL